MFRSSVAAVEELNSDEMDDELCMTSIAATGVSSEGCPALEAESGIFGCDSDSPTFRRLRGFKRSDDGVGADGSSTSCGETLGRGLRFGGFEMDEKGFVSLEISRSESSRLFEASIMNEPNTNTSNQTDFVRWREIIYAKFDSSSPVFYKRVPESFGDCISNKRRFLLVNFLSFSQVMQP